MDFLTAYCWVLGSSAVLVLYVWGVWEFWRATLRVLLAQAASSIPNYRGSDGMEYVFIFLVGVVAVLIASVWPLVLFLLTPYILRKRSRRWSRGS